MIYRVDVSPKRPGDHGLGRQMAEAGLDVGAIRATRIYLIDADATDAQLAAAANLLADPVAETAKLLTTAPAATSPSLIEVHLKPGVMDPTAGTVERALRDLGLVVREVRTGRAFAFEKPLDRAALSAIAKRYLANSVVETIHFEPHLPTGFAKAAIAPFALRHVAIRDLNDDGLTKLSRDGHLFLNLVEMRAIQAHYQSIAREPTDIELETLAQTWSEHCVHKTLKSAVEVVDEHGTVLRRYGNLIKETIFQSTMELIRGTGFQPVTNRGLEAHATFCLSVFKDNAGVIAFDDVDAVCFKVETHNRPSAIEPYGGAATGIGGCIRDVMGTGLGARPIGNTNVFCVAHPETGDGRRETGVENDPMSSSSLPSPVSRLPTNVIHPRRILQQVVAGVRDYGNRMGIPTVNGAVHFHADYVGNPLVFAGCVGILPRDKVEKRVNVGDAVVVMGGRTGRDGIHGATFSSAELTSTHADEFSHAVQIGNAITQKQMMDVLMQARDRGLYSAITDCGAGGLSSAIGEMGGDVGAEVDLDRVPLKYAGLRYDEIWISEAQERMVLSVPREHVAELLRLAAEEDVEATVIGTFGTSAQELVLRYNKVEVGRMAMTLLHDGIPMPTRRAQIRSRGVPPLPSGQKSSSDVPHQTQSSAVSLVAGQGRDAPATRGLLLAKLAEPNVASKHWIIRQYDHEVRGGTVVKPLVGPRQVGPSDAAVLRPKPDSSKGVVLACGLAPDRGDAYAMALASIDEAIRNAVCVGARLETLAILDNFCWPGVHDEVSMGTLVRACEACRDGALGYRVPFISGKDSLHNQFTDAATGRVIRIPDTLLVSAIGVIDDVGRCMTSDLKRAGDPIYLITPAPLEGTGRSERAPTDDDWRDTIARRRAVHVYVSDLIARGIVRAAHDVSDGGVLVALAEMAIGAGLGVALDALPTDPFGEPQATYVLEIDAAREAELVAGEAVVERLGVVTTDPRLVIPGTLDVSVDELTRAWRGTLDW